MNLDDLQNEVTAATKRLSQRFAQAETDRPPKKAPEITSVITSLEPGQIIRDINSQGGASAVQSGQAPSEGGFDNPETVTGAINGVPATLVVGTDGSGWTLV